MDSYSELPLNKNVHEKKPRKRWKRRFALFFVFLFLTSLGFAGWFYGTPSGTSLRYTLADTLITTQHRYLAIYLIGQNELDRRVATYFKEFDAMAQVKD